MLIAVDLHGVADSFPDLLKPLMYLLRESGNMIMVLSGPPKDQIIDKLTKLGYEAGTHYDRVESVVDFLKNEGVNMWQDEKDEWWSSDEEWWASKAAMCERFGVDILIDDSERYRPYFENSKTKFVLIDRKKQKMFNTLPKQD